MAAVVIVPLAFAALFWVSCGPWPERLLRALVLFGAAVWAITEGLSLVSAIRFAPTLACWCAVGSLAGWAAYRRRGRAAEIAGAERPQWLEVLCGSGMAAVLAGSLLTACIAPPNSSDAMAYHAPRVLYWAEQASIRFFPTPYLNQIMLQPFAEYLNLQTFVLSGSDRFFNLPQWFASAVCAVAVWAIARELGANRAGRALAALYSVTIPLGILASSGAKNDYVLAMWLATAVFFAFRWRGTRLPGDAARLGLALGFALYTKATAYLFAPWVLAAILIRPALANPRRALRGWLPALAIALAINSPLYIRNLQLSGSPMGFDSAQGNGYYRWQNEAFGFRQTASNVLRNLSEQLGRRSAAWNRDVYDAVLRAHQALGISPNDPATTWREAVYAPPRNDNHEADAPNPLHLALLAAAALVAAVLAIRGAWLPAAYALSLAAGFVIFCAYLKWQPFMGRLFLPLFVLGAPLIGVAASQIRPRWRCILAALALYLMATARLPLLDNWVRPLVGLESILRRPREQQYFADLGQFGSLYSVYASARDLLAQSGCGVIGIDASQFQLEYPIEALVRDVRPGDQFVHAGVENPSRRFSQPVSRQPCAIVCLRCAGNSERISRYNDFGAMHTIGGLIVWLRQPSGSFQ